MKNIYSKHTSSDSYTNPSWIDEDYFECESMEEYKSEVAKCRKECEDYWNSDNSEYYGKWRFTITKEQDIHASEYYYAHEWQGKNFDAIGVTFTKHLERSTHIKHILKPNSVGKIEKCVDNSCAWMYGS